MHWHPTSACWCDLPLQHLGVILWVAFVQTAFCHCQLDVCAAGPWRAQSKRDATAPDDCGVRAQAAGCLQGECHLQTVQCLLHLLCPLRPLLTCGMCMHAMFQHEQLATGINRPQMSLYAVCIPVLSHNSPSLQAEQCIIMSQWLQSTNCVKQ